MCANDSASTSESIFACAGPCPLQHASKPRPTVALLHIEKNWAKAHCCLEMKHPKCAISREILPCESSQEVKEVEKISGIVPASARVQGVNIKDSQPLRPGVPTFGRPVGISSLSEGRRLTTAEKAVAAHEGLMARRSGDAHKPAIVTDMAAQFFMKNQTQASEPIRDLDINYNLDIGPTSYTPLAEELDVPSLESELELAPAHEERLALAEADAETHDYTPPGSYLDIKA